MLERLTDGELNILKFVSQGLSNEEISNKLSISKHTVKIHIHNIYNKFELFSKPYRTHRLKATLIYLKEKYNSNDR